MYYLYFTICYLLSLPPLWVLYRLSDVLYVVVYYLLGYRREVVRANLLQAFPEKTAAERERIARRFYRNLTDMMVEAIKLMTLSRRQLQRRFTGDLTLLKELEQQGRGYQIHLGHYFNWEWANLYIKSRVSLPFLVAYKPLRSRPADRLFNRIRTRFGSVMIPSTRVSEAMAPWQGKQFINVLVADQNPVKVRRAYWYPFLHKMTAFFKGPELSARRADRAVVYGEISHRGRGRYHITVALVSDHPAREPEGAVTARFVALLEEGIRRNPENWVWSHRRWKHAFGGEQAGPEQAADAVPQT